MKLWKIEKLGTHTETQKKKYVNAAINLGVPIFMTILEYWQKENLAKEMNYLIHIILDVT